MIDFLERAGRFITECDDESEEGEEGGVGAAAAVGAESDNSE